VTDYMSERVQEVRRIRTADAAAAEFLPDDLRHLNPVEAREAWQKEDEESRLDEQKRETYHARWYRPLEAWSKAYNDEDPAHLLPETPDEMAWQAMEAMAIAQSGMWMRRSIAEGLLILAAVLLLVGQIIGR
jgi:hypothetical protein